MTVRAILWVYGAPRRDGSRNVKIYANYNGKKNYFKTDAYVQDDHWDADRGLVRKSHPLYKLLNSKIQQQVIEITQRLLEGGEVGTARKPTRSLLNFAAQFIEEVEKGLHKISMETCKHYRVTLKRLNQYCSFRQLQGLSFDQVTIEFYYDFSAYLADEHGCSRSGGTAKHIKNVKKWMNEAHGRKLHSNLAYRDKAFRAARSSASNKIYLTEDEIGAIARLDLADQPTLELERDRFLVSYFFIMRYSDSVRVRADQFFQEDDQWYYRNISKKTNRESIIPVKPDALAILQRRGFSVAGDTNQEANRKLKMIAAMAGINQVVSEGKRKGPKSNFVTTHTARRSAATNLYLQGVSIKLIADLGGWESTDMLRVYLRASGLESAKAAKDLPFFK